MILNGLPWKRTEIILSFLRLHSQYCISNSFVDHDGYSISSEGFLPAVVDIMVIGVIKKLYMCFIHGSGRSPGKGIGYLL